MFFFQFRVIVEMPRSKNVHLKYRTIDRPNRYSVNITDGVFKREKETGSAPNFAEN